MVLESQQAAQRSWFWIPIASPARWKRIELCLFHRGLNRGVSKKNAGYSGGDTLSVAITVGLALGNWAESNVLADGHVAQSEVGALAVVFESDSTSDEGLCLAHRATGRSE
jgi:hypothetical protein